MFIFVPKSTVVYLLFFIRNMLLFIEVIYINFIILNTLLRFDNSFRIMFLIGRYAIELFCVSLYTNRWPQIYYFWDEHAMQYIFFYITFEPVEEYLWDLECLQVDGQRNRVIEIINISQLLMKSVKKCIQWI